MLQDKKDVKFVTYSHNGNGNCVENMGMLTF